MSKRLYPCLFALILSTPVFADSGFYVGGDVGFSWAENPSEIDGLTQQAESDAIAINTPLDVDDSFNSASHGIFVGYWLRDDLAIEVNYAQVVNGAISYGFDTIANVGISADIDRVSLSLLQFYKLNDKFDLYGRIGYAESKANIESQSSSKFAVNIDFENYALDNDESTGVLAGVGVRFHPNEHYYMRVEAQYDDSLYGLKGIVMGFGYQF